MNSERTLWLAIGLLLTSAASLGFGALALSGFASAPAGDVAVTTGGSASYLLLAMGSAVLLALEWAHTHRRPARAARFARASAVKA